MWEALPYTDWERIISFLTDDDLANVRLVCQFLRRAIDETVTQLTVFASSVQQERHPDLKRFPACRCVRFLDESERLPLCIETHISGISSGVFVLSSGKPWWKSTVLQRWLHDHEDSITELNLFMRLTEDHQGQDLGDVLDDLMEGTAVTSVSHLWLWCERHDGVVFPTQLNWAKAARGLQHLRSLYVEFVKINAHVLGGMTSLRRLQILFEEWEVFNSAYIGSIKSLETLCLEPDAPLTVSSDMFLEFGPYIRYLKLVGPFSMLSFDEEPDWLEFLGKLFGRMTNLQCFVASKDTASLVDAALRESKGKEDARIAVADLLLCKCNTTDLWIALDKDGNHFRGVLRDPKAASVLTEGYVSTLSTLQFPHK